MNNLRILVGEKVSTEQIAIGCTETKTISTLFFKVVKNLVTKDQKTILNITATNFPNLMENIVKNSKKIIKLQIPENTQIHNGWKDSQSGKSGKKADRVNPLSRENLDKIKNLSKNYLIEIVESVLAE